MGTIDAFQRLVWSPQFKQNCFPHRSKMGVLKSFPQEPCQTEKIWQGSCFLGQTRVKYNVQQLI